MSCLKKGFEKNGFFSVAVECVEIMSVNLWTKVLRYSLTKIELDSDFFFTFKC